MKNLLKIWETYPEYTITFLNIKKNQRRRVIGVINWVLIPEIGLSK